MTDLFNETYNQIMQLPQVQAFNCFTGKCTSSLFSFLLFPGNYCLFPMQIPWVNGGQEWLNKSDRNPLTAFWRNVTSEVLILPPTQISVTNDVINFGFSIHAQKVMEKVRRG